MINNKIKKTPLISFRDNAHRDAYLFVLNV